MRLRNALASAAVLAVGLFALGGGNKTTAPPHFRLRRLFVGALAGALLITGFGPTSAIAAPAPMVNLGQASTYAVLSGASVGNTVSAPGAPHTTLRGDLGVKANTQPTGFPPGVVTGTIRVGSSAGQAHADLVAAYNEVAARLGGTPLAGALAGATISPGLHTIPAAASNTGTVTLDAGGDPNAVFVFQINGALAFAAASHVVLTNGAQASRVFWQVNGAGTLGANADFAGTLMAHDAVGMGAGTLVNGRAFALNGALTLDNNQFYSSSPVVTIAGGASDFTTDTTPTISGTTDVEAPGVVTVTVAGQTLTANVTPSYGAWSVTSAILANGTYPVVASVQDAAGNPGSATQQLTVDTVLPVVTLDGGPSVTTNDPTPTISGTSDAAVDTVVHVTVDSRALRALVHSGGTWNIRPAALTDGARTVTASVRDAAGNEGTDSQVLTVDTLAPAVTITGAASALTNDATPDISGTAAVAPGTTVTVNLADQTLTAPVDNGGAWSVTAAALSDGPHRVVMSVSDAAGNQAGATQTLTVDTVSPVVTIAGGANATTHDVTPTIAGTSAAAPGTTVTVSIAGQTMTTLLQTDGSWNTTPTFVGEGTWSVVASAPDPAGNVGTATQTLRIDTTRPGAPALSISNVSVNPERNSRVKRATFTITLAPASGKPVTVDVATANGTARAPGDYAAKTASDVTFLPGETTKSFVVQVKGDTLDEPNETFRVNLSGATNAVVGDRQGVGTIVDDDPKPTLSIRDVSNLEGDSGTSPYVFTVRLSVKSGRTVTVRYATANGSAVQPEDYLRKSGALTFAPGQTVKTITVTVKGDTKVEPTQTFKVNLSRPSNAGLRDSSATGTIRNDA